MRLCGESLIVAGVCCADLISTIVCVRYYGATEANVVMRYYLQHGLAVFMGAKCFLFVPALLIAEWYRSRNPRLILRTLRLVIFLYIGLYGAGVVVLNRSQVHADPPAATSGPAVRAPESRQERPLTRLSGTEGGNATWQSIDKALP